jgi:hypothetical protein
MLNLHRLSYCTILQLPTSRGYPLPRTDSSLNRMNSVTYTAKERTCITGNSCHVTTTRRCVTSPRTRKTEPPLLLRVVPCLQSCCLATRSSNPLQYHVAYFTVYSRRVAWHNFNALDCIRVVLVCPNKN